MARVRFRPSHPRFLPDTKVKYRDHEKIYFILEVLSINEQGQHRYTLGWKLNPYSTQYERTEIIATDDDLQRAYDLL